jgi:protein TonB
VLKFQGMSNTFPMRLVCVAFVTALWYPTPVLGQSPSAASGSTSDSSSNENPPHAGTEGVTIPKCTYMPRPPYTKEAKKAKVKGIVLVEGVVGLDGRLTNLRVVKALGYDLDESALNTLKTWKCDPAIGPNGKPVPALVPIEVNFRLH